VRLSRALGGSGRATSHLPLGLRQVAAQFRQLDPDSIYLNVQAQSLARVILRPQPTLFELISRSLANNFPLVLHPVQASQPRGLCCLADDDHHSSAQDHTLF
jgi:hypothetical protein